jgi:hypothetical protein
MRVGSLSDATESISKGMAFTANIVKGCSISLKEVAKMGAIIIVIYTVGSYTGIGIVTMVIISAILSFIFFLIEGRIRSGSWTATFFYKMTSLIQ